MKKISPAVYENLTPRQRVIATIEAEARDDQEEVRRLVSTCPKKTYLATDAAYTDTMLNLMSLALAVEGDLLHMALTCTMAMKRRDDLFDKQLQRLADMNAAWQETLEAYGIAPDIMAKAAPPRHIWVENILKYTPPPIPENVQIIREVMGKNL